MAEGSIIAAVIATHRPRYHDEAAQVGARAHVHAARLLDDDRPGEEARDQHRPRRHREHVSSRARDYVASTPTTSRTASADLPSAACSASSSSTSRISSMPAARRASPARPCRGRRSRTRPRGSAVQGRTRFSSSRIASTICAQAAPGAYQAEVPEQLARPRRRRWRCARPSPGSAPRRRACAAARRRPSSPRRPGPSGRRGRRARAPGRP